MENFNMRALYLVYYVGLVTNVIRGANIHTIPILLSTR